MPSVAFSNSFHAGKYTVANFGLPGLAFQRYPITAPVVVPEPESSGFGISFATAVWATGAGAGAGTSNFEPVDDAVVLGVGWGEGAEVGLVVETSATGAAVVGTLLVVLTCEPPKTELQANTKPVKIFIKKSMPQVYTFIARAMGLEPTTSSVTGKRSNQLSYARIQEHHTAKVGLVEPGVGGRTCTFDLGFMSPML